MKKLALVGVLSFALFAGVGCSNKTDYGFLGDGLGPARIGMIAFTNESTAWAHTTKLGFGTIAEGFYGNFQEKKHH